MVDVGAVTDTFSGTALAAGWVANGGGVAAGSLYVNCAHTAGTPAYSSVRRSTNYTFTGSTFTWYDVVWPGPAGDAANGQLWVMDTQPAAIVDRLGFEYVGSANRLDLIGQSGASYSPIGTTTSLTYDPVAHRHLRVSHAGSSILWQTSSDGLTWTTRRNLTTVPSWTGKTTLQPSAEAFRTAGVNDTLRVGAVNTPPPALPAAAPAGQDALQRRTLTELRAWRQWLTANNAAGFVGEFNSVTLAGKYGDAAQQANWDALLAAYIDELDYSGVHGAVWASGREWGQGYPLGVHVGVNVGDPLTIANQGTSNVIAARPSRGRWRGVNLSGWEQGITINGGGEVRASAGYVHTAADFALLAANGVDTIRLPFAWERLQPTLGAALSATALTALDGMLTAARQYGIRVILDCHNYGRYTQADGVTVAALGGALGNAQFNDLWTRLSTWVRASTSRSATVIGYGLMNEPHALAGGASTWQTASQAALTAIRNGGDNRWVLVAGYTFSSLTEWAGWHPTGWITDPAGNFAYEAHHYWDTTSVAADGTTSQSRAGVYQQPKSGGGVEILTYAREAAAASDAENYRTNLCVNPSLETNATGHTIGPVRSGVATSPASGAVALRSSTVAAQSGTYYGYVNITGPGTAGAAGPGARSTPDTVVNLPTFPVTAGTRYSLSVSRLANLSGITDVLAVRWLDGNGNEIGEAPSQDYYWSVTTAWGLAWRYNDVAPGGAVTCAPTLRVFVPADATLRSYRWDAVLYRRNAADIAYFDGDAAGASWTGTPHGSTSLIPVTTTAESHARTVTDIALAADIPSRAGVHTQTVTDTVAAADTVAFQRNENSAATDSVPVADSALADTGYQRWQVDAIGSDDTTASEAVYARDYTDTAPSGDSVEFSSLRSEEFTDSTDTSDELAYVLGADVQIVDTADTADTTEQAVVADRDLLDQADASDSVDREAAHTHTVTDNVDVHDTAVAVRGQHAEIIDSAGVADSAAGEKAATAVITDVADVADTVTRVAPATQRITDTAPVSDSVDIVTRGRITAPAPVAIEDNTATALAPGVSHPVPPAVEFDTSVAPDRRAELSAPRALSSDSGFTPRPTGSWPTEQAGEWDVTFPPIVLVDDGEFATAIDDEDRVPVYVLKADWNRNGLYDHPLSDLTSLVTRVSVSKALQGALPAEVGLVEGYSTAEMSVTLEGEISAIFQEIEERRNLVINPSFESHTLGWTSNGENGSSIPREQGAVIDTGPITPRYGSWYAYTRRTTTGDLTFYPTALSPVQAGLTYTGSIYVNRDGVNGVRLDIDWYNSSGAYLSSAFGAVLHPPVETWTQLVTSGQAPGGATQARIFVRLIGQTGGWYARFDAALLERVTSVMAGQFFDGNSPGARWVGTANNSVSVRSGVAGAQVRDTGREFDVVDAFAPYRRDSPLYGFPLLQTPIYLETGFLADDGPRTARRFTGTVTRLHPASAARSVELSAMDAVNRLRATLTLSGVAMYESILARYGPDQYRERINSQWLIDYALRRNGIYTSPPCREDAILSVTMHGSTIPEIGWGGAPEGISSTYRGDAWFPGRFGGALSNVNGTSGRWWLTEQVTAASGTGFGFSQWLAMYPNGAAAAQYFSMDLTTDASWFINFGVDTAGRPYLESRNVGGSTVRATPGGFSPPTVSTWRFVGVHVSFTATQMTVRFRIAQTTYTSTVTIGARPDRWKPGIFIRHSYRGPFQNFQMWKSTAPPAGVWQGEDPNWVPQADLDPGVNELTGIPELRGEDSWELIKEVVEAEGSTFQFDEYGRPQFRTAKGDEYYERTKTVKEIVSADRNLADLVSTTDETTVRNVINVKTSALLVSDWKPYFEATDIYEFYVGANSTSYFEVDMSGSVYEIPPPLSTFGCRPSGPNCYAYAGGTGFIFFWAADDWSGWSKLDYLKAYIRVLAVYDNNPTVAVGEGIQIRVVRLTPWRMQIIINNQNSSPIRFSTRRTVDNEGRITSEGEPSLVIPARSLINGPGQVETYTDNSSVATYGASPFDVGGGASRWLQTPYGFRKIATEVLSTTASPVPVLEAVDVPHDPRRKLADRLVLRDPDGLGEVTASIVGMVQTFSPNGAADQLTVRPIGPPT